MKEIFVHIKSHSDEYLARLKRACAINDIDVLVDDTAGTKYLTTLLEDLSLV